MREKAASSPLQNFLALLGLFGIFAVAFILFEKMSKKHKDKQSPENPADNNQKPVPQGKTHWPSLYPVRIEPTTEDNQWKAKQEKVWGRQITIAKVLNWVTAAAAIVGLIYGFVNYWILGAMKDANRLSAQNFKVSQRSYIAIGRKDGVIANFVTSKDPKQNAELVMYFQNSGHLPAQLAWGTLGLNFMEGAPTGTTSSGVTYTHPFKGMTRTRDKKTGSVGGVGESAVVPGDSTFVARIGEIAPAKFAELRSKGIGLLIMGMYQYCDEMGTDIRHQFSIGFQNAPNPDLNFYLVNDGEIPYPHPQSTVDTDYLPPCKTLAEREAEEAPSKK